MLRILVLLLGLFLLACPLFAQVSGSRSAGGAVRFITVDPAHFHASLVHKEMYPQVSKKVAIYAPLGQDLLDHLGRMVLFNKRPVNPTSWELDIHTSPDFFERMLKEKPGNVVVFAGRNRIKIDYIKASVDNGLNVLADKPWIIKTADLPKLEAVLNAATKKGLVAYDLMTERYEITTMLQKELVNDPEVFGTLLKGSANDPAVYMESIHNLMKMVAGAPLLRPAWFFDVNEQGEGLTDVGTHLVDLVSWTLFQNQMLNYHKDVEVVAAKRWPTVLTKEQFQRVTGEKDFTGSLAANIRNGSLEYFCNTQVSYALRGVNVKLDVLWNYEAPAGTGDSHNAWYKGTKSRVEIRQGKDEKYKPELYVFANSDADREAVTAAVRKHVQGLQAKFPGVGVEEKPDRVWITIPDKYRLGHEYHFSQVTNQFLGYMKDPKSLPAWENANMLAKYYVTTKGVELSHKN